MTSEVQKLIVDVRDAASNASDYAGAIQDEVMLLVDEDCDLPKEDIEDISDMLTRISDIATELDRNWSILIRILERNTEFYGKKG